MSDIFDKFNKYSKFESSDTHYEIHWDNPDMPFIVSKNYWWNTSDINKCGNLCFYRDLGEGCKEKIEFIFDSYDGKCALRVSINTKIGYYDDWESVCVHTLNIIN